MDASENSGSRFGRSVWTVWGYLTGAVARYLRPEVTDEGNQNDVVSKNTANEINSEEKENEAEKKVEGKKCNENENNTEVKSVLPEARTQVALAQWENTDVVMDDHTELQVNATKKQTYHCAVWSIGTNHDESVSCDDVDSDGHKQKSGTSTLDVQIDDKKEEKQKSEARVEKKPVSSDASCEDNVERKVSETEEEPFEIVDSKQKDGSNKDKKEQKCYHEDDHFQECEFMREDQNNAEVTIKPELYGQDVEQEKLINNMDYREIADIRGTEYTTDFPKEKGVECVIDEKEQQTVVQNQELEKVEDFEDEETESQVKDGDSKEDGAFSNPLEIGRLEVIKKHSEEIIENEHILKNELGSMDTTEQDKDIQESEQLNWLDTCELAGTGICNIEEVHDGRLGETQTTQTKNVDETKSVLLNLEDTLPRASEEIFEEIVLSNEPGRTTATVVDSFFETVATSKDNLQSDLSKQDTPQTGTGSPVVAIKTEAMFSDLIVCELFGEFRKGPETGAVDQVKTVETSLGSFEEIKTTLDEPNTLTEEHSQRDTVVPRSVELDLKDSKEAIEIEQDIETPIDCLNATLQEMDKTEFSPKKHVELRTALTFETVETKTCSKKAKVKTFETNSQADSELDLTTERERKLSQATLDTVSESLEEGESIVVCAIAGTEPYPVDLKLDAEDAPDVIVAKIGPVGSQTELTRPLSPAEFLVETLDLKKDSYIYSEGQENREIRLLDETEALKTTLEYVEEITNQVLKEMMEMENNVEQDVEPLVGLSTEKLGDAEFQELPTGTLVLEQENMEVSKFLAGTEESIVEMEVETSICEVVKKQNDDHILAPVSETTDAVERIEEKGAAGETVLCCHEDIIEISKSGIKRRFENMSKDVPEVKIEGEEKAPTTDWPTTVDLDLQEFKDSSLDFSVQKSRIAVKNPLVRPPKDPRKLIFKTSVEPFLPKPPACGLLKGGQGIAVSVPSKGFIGFKLPGVGTEMPILRKTEFGKKARESGEAESRLQAQEQQKSEAVTEDSVKQEPASLKPKWTPPRHTGMGSPLMIAELKGKLKKPLKE